MYGTAVATYSSINTCLECNIQDLSVSIFEHTLLPNAIEKIK